MYPTLYLIGFVVSCLQVVTSFLGSEPVYFCILFPSAVSVITFPASRALGRTFHSMGKPTFSTRGVLIFSDNVTRLIWQQAGNVK